MIILCANSSKRLLFNYRFITNFIEQTVSVHWRTENTLRWLFKDFIADN